MNSAENKNLVLAMVLMLAVWLGFSFFFPPQKEQQAESAQTTPVAASQEKEEAVVTDKVVEVETLPAAGETPVSVDAQTSTPAREIMVETDKYQAVFTTEGARLISFKLKEYMATAAKDSAPVQMYETGPLRYSTLRTTGAEGFGLSEGALFETATASVVSVNGQEQLEILFKHVAANGMQYVKSFNVRGDEYVIDMALELSNASQTPLRGTVNLAMVQRWDDSMEGDSYSFSGPATLVKDEIEEVDVDDLKDGFVSYGQDLSWTSFQTKYFLSVVVPGDKTVERILLQRKGDAIENIMETPYFTLQPGEKRTLDYLVFIGPKEPAQLKAAGHQLDKIVQFGFFNLLAQPLFTVLTFFYGFFKNYGVAIILLTVLIKIIFWPLTHKSYSSMKSMQKLQPEMAKLREKFKNDKERLNKEMMQLYKTHSVNPLGGCLPMIVQIPVFFALYKVLLDSIALRHAPFAFWLTDLSAKDPYYITPILMGASMFVQQKMTPTTADPMQAKIFMMMPIVFTFMFLNFPSGLVIYWLVNNLLTILQQYFIHRKAT
ncbi:membrane protein insertase YidC [Deltaproteobacteria bacterium IMCC39524]|nr:membrane protein insertase YidC [Deltaproteobacteria bacterium IMCC39524]